MIDKDWLIKKLFLKCRGFFDEVRVFKKQQHTAGASLHLHIQNGVNILPFPKHDINIK